MWRIGNIAQDLFHSHWKYSKKFVKYTLRILILQVFSLLVQFYDQCQTIGLEYCTFKIQMVNISGHGIIGLWWSLHISRTLFMYLWLNLRTCWLLRFFLLVYLLKSVNISFNLYFPASCSHLVCPPVLNFWPWSTVVASFTADSVDPPGTFSVSDLSLLLVILTPDGC